MIRPVRFRGAFLAASRFSASSERIAQFQCRAFTPSIHRFKEAPETERPDTTSGNSHTQPAWKLSHDEVPEEKEHYEKEVKETKRKEVRAPWHREGSEVPPAEKDKDGELMTKGKLLTTPSRMLKLILPITSYKYSPEDRNTDNIVDKEGEPLALLVHPQQPLSYLERLIQSELPAIKEKDGQRHEPNIWFRAEDTLRQNEDLEEQESREEDAEPDPKKKEQLRDADVEVIGGKSTRTGKLNRRSDDVVTALKGGEGEGGVESYSGKGQDSRITGESNESSPDQEPSYESFVRWSPSTEIGDFIREAARSKYFAIEIEGAPKAVLVGVPSFNDRTYYLRMRLRKKSKEISELADLKKECDQVAERGAKRVAMAGGAGLVGYWIIVYAFTFETDLGWDVMEPVTYLVGLSTLIGGYAWFLVHNRQVSYRSAMNFTISRRQSHLYQQKGFDLRRWEDLIDEGNRLRREIKSIAQEYDVDWDETKDAESQKVIDALKKEAKKRKRDDDDKEERKEEKEAEEH